MSKMTYNKIMELEKELINEEQPQEPIAEQVVEEQEPTPVVEEPIEEPQPETVVETPVEPVTEEQKVSTPTDESKIEVNVIKKANGKLVEIPDEEMDVYLYPRLATPLLQEPNADVFKTEPIKAQESLSSLKNLLRGRR